MVLDCQWPSLGLRYTKILSSSDNTHKYQYLTGITILILVGYVVWYHHSYYVLIPCFHLYSGPTLVLLLTQGLTLKYYTSKISEFADLQTLSSFGFRGEALSSLCALSNVSVTTRTKEEAVGTRLEYDHSGVITSRESVARAVGTTVAISKLFSPLPVRYKEFNRNIRREYGRLLSVLQVDLLFPAIFQYWSRLLGSLTASNM